MPKKIKFVVTGGSGRFGQELKKKNYKKIYFSLKKRVKYFKI